MRALLLGLNYAPEPVGIGPYTTGIAEALVAAGHEIEVVTAKPYYPAWSVDPAHARRGWRREQRNGVALLRCPLYVPRTPGGIRRVLHHLSFAATALAPMLAAARRRPQLVVAIAPSLLSVTVAWLAAKLARAPLWVHVQDFEVEAAFATGLLGQRGWLQRAALAIENRLLRATDLVSTISPQMTAKLIQKGVDPHRVRELRNWAEDAFRPTTDGVARYREQWALRHRQVLLYSGNIAAKQGIGIIIDAARKLVGRGDIVFVICGEGPNRAALESAAFGLPNVRLAPLQPAERMGDLLALAAVHLLPQLPGTADLVLPSKLTNILASGRPVVATAAPGTGLFAEVEGCGVATPPGDAAAFTAAIASLIDHPTRRAALGKAAAERARERWSRSTILARFVATAEALATRAKPAGRLTPNPAVTK